MGRGGKRTSLALSFRCTLTDGWAFKEFYFTEANQAATLAPGAHQSDL